MPNTRPDKHVIFDTCHRNFTSPNNPAYTHLLKEYRRILQRQNSSSMEVEYSNSEHESESDNSRENNDLTGEWDIPECDLENLQIPEFPCELENMLEKEAVDCVAALKSLQISLLMFTNSFYGALLRSIEDCHKSGGEFDETFKEDSTEMEGMSKNFVETPKEDTPDPTENEKEKPKIPEPPIEEENDKEDKEEPKEPEPSKPRCKKLRDWTKEDLASILKDKECSTSNSLSCFLHFVDKFYSIYYPYIVQCVQIMAEIERNECKRENPIFPIIPKDSNQPVYSMKELVKSLRELTAAMTAKKEALEKTPTEDQKCCTCTKIIYETDELPTKPTHTKISIFNEPQQCAFSEADCKTVTIKKSD